MIHSHLAYPFSYHGLIKHCVPLSCPRKSVVQFSQRRCEETVSFTKFWISICVECNSFNTWL